MEDKQPTNDQAGHENELKDRKMSWEKLDRIDSFHVEAGKTLSNVAKPSLMSWRTTLSLAFQTDGIDEKDDVVGVLSLIIYTLALIPLLKYVFIVLRANDNGEGGTFALYSLICRYAKIGLIPNQEPEDKDLSNYRLEPPTTQLKRAHKIKEKLENSRFSQILLFLLAIMGTSMVIGDGVLTPSISVLSSVGGIKSLGQDAVVGVSVAILILLFAFQRFGTDKVGFSFAPIIIIWFSFLTGIGLYNLFKHDITVLRAINPLYIIQYFKRNGKRGWISLGGIFLCITGTEAMFADLGHFNVRAIQISFSCITFPALATIYCGQAAYLIKHPENVSNTFYDSVPDPLYWPTFVVAVAATIIASQAMISGAFSIVSQSLRLGCFPRVKVIHTSASYEGQVYIPEINYLLMVACVIVTISFKTTEKIGNAYGIAVVTVMVITTLMVSLIMLIIWKTSIWWILVFLIVFGVIEMVYVSSVMYKFTNGGYLPLALAGVLMVIMAIWHYVHILKYRYELREKISSEFTRDLARNPNIHRVPGIGLFYTELVQGITPLFSHYISNVSSVHSVFVLVSIKSLPVNRVALSERFLFRYVEPRDFGMFKCVVRYGYKEDIEDPHEFERQLVHYLKEFIRHEYFISGGGALELENNNVSTVLVNEETGKQLAVQGDDDSSSEKVNEINVSSTNVSRRSSGRIVSINSSVSNKVVSERIQITEDQTDFVGKAREKGVVYLMGETEIMAENNSSSLFKKFIVNHAYNFLKKNCREGDKSLAIPRSKLLKVGMTYEL
ncbi:PREDICTED: potassium transporter 5-like [Tarenaya hassleriana]|uniref:potassium transporter 5-like n=1 Tax=Tarenaya hassleriana TaxID=28532 RepID=UPI0008FD80C6|nr:PREDICTED: potassium transporter 5-like [Tarenaya hassleriana]